MISVERIKPSSPTPHHLRTYNISLLDQLMPCAYVTLVLYFFSDGDDNGNRVQHLKESLSQTLVTFYPFAGVIRDALSADCNDQGLPLYVIKVNAQMRDFLQNPNVELINKFFPGEYGECGRDKLPGPGDSTMLIQLNCFECGGISTSIVFCHSIADLVSISTFLRCWASYARGLEFDHVSPLICAAQSSFPQKPSLPETLVPFNNILKYSSPAKFVTRRYIFDASVLSILKAQLVSSSTGATPSRVDVVTAVIWKCFMEAVAEESAGKDPKPYVMAHAVNMRRRAAPPFLEDSFGNFVWTPVVVCNNPQEKKLTELVWEVKKGVANIDGKFVRRLGSDGLFEFLEGLRKEMPQQAKLLGITSWSNMGLCEVDFGWGKPVWLSGSVADNSESETVGNGNFVTLIDTSDGGIEACAIFDHKYVAEFEKNDHIRKYARVNPSVI
ncbi:amino-acid N-acetyltransferase [Salvia divinorum]|uniref:Amino-acid N-acetyltransferase n=1 Tax=Salvia divinorum TaxID=28513 RepID=A0ABD1FQR1_SALDI